MEIYGGRVRTPPGSRIFRRRQLPPGLAVLAALLLSGCHLMASHKTGPEGRSMHDTDLRQLARDEAFVEALMIDRGLDVRYAPDAMVYNMGPETFSDFVRQRRRNYAGHLHLKRKYGYRVSSLDNARVARLALSEAWGAISRTFRLLYVLTTLAAIEIYSRILGSYDYYVKGDKYVVWDMAWTTKEVDEARMKATEESQNASAEE